jgi:hypothetical protein
VTLGGKETVSKPESNEAAERASGSLERMVGQHVIHCKRTELTQDKTTVENRDVILMAVCGNYSMVRRPRCIPYVCDTRDLLPNAPGERLEAK